MTIFRRLLFAVTLPGILLQNAAGADEQQTKALFERISPSVVFIGSAEGGGSGVVVSRDGLVLSNDHVVNTPLPLFIEADALDRQGKRSRQKFSKVQVISIHPKYDLAVIQVQLGDYKLIPVTFSTSRNDTQPGTTCFALGYPYLPKQDKPAIVITKGMVNSNERTIDGAVYLQVDAAVHPGNSGGALIDAKGLLIGIPTMKLEGADNVAVAIPAINIRNTDFKPATTRTRDPQKAAQLAAASNRMLFARLFGSVDPEYALEIELLLMRQAIALDPENPGYLGIIADYYLQVGAMESAKAYAEAWKKTGSKDVQGALIYSGIFSAAGNTAEAKAQLIATLATAQVGENATREQHVKLLQRLIPLLYKENDLVRAAYLIEWLKREKPGVLDSDLRIIDQKIAPQIPAGVAAFLAGTEYNVAGMEDFVVNLRKGTLPVASAPPKTTPAPEPQLPSDPVDQYIEKRFPLTAVPGQSCQLVAASGEVRLDTAKNELVWKLRPFQPPSYYVRVALLFTDAAGATNVRVQELRNAPK